MITIRDHRTRESYRTLLKARLAAAGWIEALYLDEDTCPAVSTVVERVSQSVRASRTIGQLRRRVNTAVRQIALAQGRTDFLGRGGYGAPADADMGPWVE